MATKSNTNTTKTSQSSHKKKAVKKSTNVSINHDEELTPACHDHLIFAYHKAIKDWRENHVVPTDERAFKFLKDTETSFQQEIRRRQKAALDKINSTHASSPSSIVLQVKRNTNKNSDDICHKYDNLSLHWIQHASPAALRKAVRDKQLSPARCRIELARRKRKDYYSCIPDTAINEAPRLRTTTGTDS